MNETLCLNKIATIYTEFPEKFGIPRQSGLAHTSGKIVFEPEYQVEEALREIKAYSHLWLNFQVKGETVKVREITRR